MKRSVPLRRLLSLVASVCFLVVVVDASLPHVRPPADQRKFVSTAVDEVIANLTSRMASPDLATLFENCYPNTLDTTVYEFTPRSSTQPPSAFVITGDIPAQWLRDSSNQLLPYMRLAASDAHLAELICGLINRQARDVAHDPFANAFNLNASGAGHQDDTRRPPMTPQVFEGKYELDSLAVVLKLASAYFNATGDHKCFLQESAWADSMNTLVKTIQAMQEAADSPLTSPYLFQRVGAVPTDSQMLGGMGSPTAWTGMSRSPFRPSDDASTFQYLIPAQAMAVVELRALAGMIGQFMDLPVSEELDDTHFASLESLASTAAVVADQIDQGIRSHGIVQSAAMGDSIYAYEVDGFGSANLMDDANCPSLLSLPYLGYTTTDDALYARTRAFVWSSRQPFWFSGTAGAGIGGPHVGMGQIWPMSVVMFALTSTEDTEIAWALDTLVASSAGTGFLHESFDKNDVSTFTRPWFAWVNGLFGELIMKIADERPHLIFGKADQQQQEGAWPQMRG